MNGTVKYAVKHRTVLQCKLLNQILLRCYYYYTTKISTVVILHFHSLKAMSVTTPFLHADFLTAIFQVNLGQPVFTEAKDDGSGGDNWSYKSCKAPVKSSPPTSSFFTRRMPFLSPIQQCKRKKLNVDYLQHDANTVGFCLTQRCTGAQHTPHGLHVAAGSQQCGCPRNARFWIYWPITNINHVIKMYMHKI